MFDELNSRFRTAAKNTDDLRIEVAGRPVTIRFADSATSRALGSALRHLGRDDDRAPDLLIHAWSGGPRPFRLGEARSPNGGRYIQRSSEGIAYEDTIEDLISAFSPDRSEAWHWAAAPDSFPPWEIAAPMRMIWSWWLSTMNHVLVHAAGIAANGKGILAVGPGGSGKSTLALSCLQAGLGFAGDDYVALDPAALAVSSLYASAKIASEELLDGMERGAAGASGPGSREMKQTVFVGKRHAHQLVSSFRAVALVLPTYDPTRRTSQVARASQADAMRAIAVPSVLQLTGYPGESLEMMAVAVKALPEFHLRMGTDSASSVRAIRELVGS